MVNRAPNPLRTDAGDSVDSYIGRVCMKVLDIYKKITDEIYLLLDYFSRCLILYMVIIVFGQVILRGTFKMNISWGEETVLLAMVWLTFASMSIGVKEEAHIRIEFFMARFPKSIRKVIVVFNNVVLLAINICMVYFGYQLVCLTAISKLPVTKLPTSAIFYLIPVSAAVSCLALIGKLFGLYKVKSEKNFVEGIYEEEALTEEENK